MRVSKQRQRVLGPIRLVGMLLWISLQGCGVRVRPIQSLQTLQQYPKTVIVQGIVRDRVPLIGQSVYQVQDASGTIWVVSSSRTEAVAIGVSVRVEGDVYYHPIPELDHTSIDLRNDHYYLKELRHHIIEP